MAYFVISYDLHHQRTYGPVWALLEQWEAVRGLESLWFVELNNTAAEVRDALQTVVDNDDSIVVVQLKKGSGWGTIRAPAAAKWMKANLSA